MPNKMRDRVLAVMIVLFAVFNLLKPMLEGTALAALVPVVSILSMLGFVLLHGPRQMGWARLGAFFVIASVISWSYESASILTGMQNGHDADVAIRKPPPVDDMMLVPEVEAFDAELCRDRPRRHAVALDPVESCEQVVDVAISLFVTPSVTCVAVNLVKPKGCGFLNAHGHPVTPGFGRSPRRR